MFLWVKHLSLISLIAVVMLFSASLPISLSAPYSMNGMGDGFNVKHSITQKAIDQKDAHMPCHQEDGGMKMKHNNQNSNGDCCDHDCKCAFSHCSNIVALVIQNFAISATILGEFKGLQNPQFEINSAQSLLERPPKYYS